MNKNEITNFLEELSTNNLFSDLYRNKFKEISTFIDENVKQEVVKKESVKTSETSELKLIQNELFADGKNYEVYTDGGCLVNPGGPGGYGVVILEDGKEITLSQGYISTTNNRMELRGPIAALSYLPEGSNIILYSDSRYFGNPLNEGWLENWLKTDWKKGTVKNIDLWKQFIPLYNKHHIEIRWVKGHADIKYNEMCDELATQAYSDTENLIEDEGFE